MTYSLRYSIQAVEDIERVIDYIEQELFSLAAAERFANGIFAKINQLKINADVFAVSIYEDVRQYDVAARHVTYKGFAIIYSIHARTVVIHRIIHNSLIKK